MEQELLTLPEQLNLLPVFSGVRVALLLVFCVVFCRLMFVLFFFLPLYCLYFLDVRLFITRLVSSTYRTRCDTSDNVCIKEKHKC